MSLILYFIYHVLNLSKILLGRDALSLLNALVNIAKSSLTKSLPSGEGFPPKKAARRQIIPSQPLDGTSVDAAGINTSRSPLSEASPSQSHSIESPVQVIILLVSNLNGFLM